MRFDDMIFRWIKEVGAQQLSLDESYAHNKAMCSHIFEVHRHLFFMRKLRGHNHEHYLVHMNKCQNALAKIEFLCALSGRDTNAPELSRLFIQMANYELSDYNVLLSNTHSQVL